MRGKHTQDTHKPGWRWLRRTLWITGGLVAVLFVANAALWVAYRDRVPPNYSLGILQVGNMPLNEARELAAGHALYPEIITLTTPGGMHDITTDFLGIHTDVEASLERLESSRTLIPLFAFLRNTTVPAVLEVDEQAYAAAVTRLSDELYIEPLPERVAFEGEAFGIAEPEEGHRVEHEQFGAILMEALRAGRTNLTVPTTVEAPPEGTANLESELQRLQDEQATQITYRHDTHRQQPSTQDIGSWYERDGQTMQPSEERIEEYLEETAGHFGITPHNTADAVAATLYALDSGEPIDFVLTADDAPVRYAYCTDVRDIDDDQLSAFSRQAAAILGDPRGWNAEGQISFVRAGDDCDFTLWLSAPEQVPAFGWPCDSEWSCRVGRNVIINYDRWHGATDPWNEAGESLTDYRALVVNHEVGHWLGFGHLPCTGDGDPAPVMMQQSMELDGCEFNPWPVESELDVVKQDRGIAALRAREDTLVAEPCCCAQCASSRA